MENPLPGLRVIGLGKNVINRSWKQLYTVSVFGYGHFGNDHSFCAQKIFFQKTPHPFRWGVDRLMGLRLLYNDFTCTDCPSLRSQTENVGTSW